MKICTDFYAILFLRACILCKAFLTATVLILWKYGMYCNMKEFSIWIFVFLYLYVFYLYFEFRIALCSVLGLKEIYINVT